MNNLNNDQKQAVLHTTGPALVLAGPGSGKTTVITARCAYLINHMEIGQIISGSGDVSYRASSVMTKSGLPAGGILTVAFNKAAAKEMSDRYKELYSNKDGQGKCLTYTTSGGRYVSMPPTPHFSTFHSFCNSVICKYEKYTQKTYKRLSEKGEGICKENILNSIYTDTNNIKLTSTELNKLSNELSKIKNNIKSGAELSMSNFKKIDTVFDTYEKYKYDNNYIDFDDMLYNARDIFVEYPHILKEIQNQYLYYQVDEGQDLSCIQLDILKMLSRNVFIVGDDDQGIYSFRGAEPERIVRIEKYFSDCKIYYLRQNYRSTQKIVDLSGGFIKQNAVRFDKDFITEMGKGKKPKCKVFSDDSELLAFIYAKISSPKHGLTGILYRNGASSTLPSIMCYKNNIPFEISGGTGRFFDSFVSADILELFKNEAARKNIFQNKPEKILGNFISDGYMECMTDKCERLSLRFEDMLRYLCAWEYFVKGYKNCNQILKAYDDLKNTMSKALQKGSPCCARDEGTVRAVSLSTIHSAKGLEYDTVFMIDLYKGEFPKNCGEDEMCEERRLFYVGMTRAKKYLYMMYPGKRQEIRLLPGEFFKTISTGRKI